VGEVNAAGGVFRRYTYRLCVYRRFTYRRFTYRPLPSQSAKTGATASTRTALILNSAILA
jgi:hypothetical protein